MGYKKQRFYNLRGSAKKYGRSLARNNKKGLLHQILRNKRLEQHAAKRIGMAVTREVQILCSDTFMSIFRERSRASMEHFSWDTLWCELQTAAPTSVCMLQACFNTSGKSQAAKPVLIMLMAMILKHRNPKMNIVQSIVSLILYAGHAGKQVRKYNAIINFGY